MMGVIRRTLHVTHMTLTHRPRTANDETFPTAESARSRTPGLTGRCVALIVCALATASCESINSNVKPKAVPATAFLKHSGEMKAEPERSPFRLNWTNSSPAARAAYSKKKQIAISVVTLDHLRPMSKSLAKIEKNEVSRQDGVRKLASLAREEFSAAFRHSKTSPFRVVEHPGKDSLTLELAIVDLNPNTFSGAVVRTAVNAVAVPGTDLILASAARPLKGNIAIEGRLGDSRTGVSLFEFADNEESKSPVFINVRDFTTYGQARLAIREWAAQFEQLLRTPEGGQVKDSPSMTFRLW